jgi:hypothetical protein
MLSSNKPAVMQPDIYSRILDYEVARDLINTKIAGLSSRLGDEEGKLVPDQSVIDDLEKQMIEAAIEQELLPGPYD